MSRIEDDIWNLVESKVTEMKMKIYDVEYLKEGTNWYLRIYIDKEGGISIEDCEAVSRAIEPIIDKADPIKTAYCLEVSSPGIERTLKRPEHFESCMGEKIEVSLFQTFEKKKKIGGILEEITLSSIKINSDGKEYIVEKDNIAKAKKIYEF